MWYRGSGEVVLDRIVSRSLPPFLLFLTLPWIGLQCVIVVFSDHSHYFLAFNIIKKQVSIIILLLFLIWYAFNTRVKKYCSLLIAILIDPH